VIFAWYDLVEGIMRYCSTRSLNNIFKVAVLTLLISFSLYSISFSQGKNVGRLDKLIQDLKDKDFFVRRNAAYALGEIRDARAAEPLIAALKDKNLEIIAGAYDFFIRRGAAGAELVEALDKYGTKAMAEDFTNSGNNPLEEAGRKWAGKHGYEIHTQPGSYTGPIWGRQ
jgi:hypothetical protein